MNSIKVTQSAWTKITDIMKQSNNKHGFVYSASSGGCNGFNFELNLLDTELYKSIIGNKYHTILTNEKTKLYIDPSSELYLLGTTIDYIHQNYEKGQYESKFKFDINKELATSCGCGISFSPK